GAIFLATEGSGVLVSRDGGLSWRPTGPGGPPDAHSLLAAGDAEGTVYALAYDSVGFFRCRDLCESWEALPQQGGPVALALDAGDPGTLYGGFSAGVRRSLDGGQSWEQTSLTAFTYGLASDPVRPGRLYASTDQGLFQTADGAGTWAALPRPPAVSHFSDWIVCAGAVDGTLYALTDSGLFRTEDRGSHWVDLAPPFETASVRAMAEQPGRPGRILAATKSGIWKSEDAGTHWPLHALSGEGQIWAFAFDPTSPSNVYAATSASASARSADGGETWTASSEGVTNAQVVSIAVEPSSPGTAYASGTLLWKTVDGGRRWKPTSGPAPSFIVPTSSTLYARTGTGLFRSVDQAESWVQAKGSGLPTFAGLSALAVPEESPARVFLGTYAGLFRSEDSGENFSPVPGFPDGDVDVIVVDAGGKTLYAATSVCSDDYAPLAPPSCVSHLSRSGDGATSWQALPLSLPTNDSIFGISVDPQRPSRVFVVHSRGLERSVDAGQSWVSIPLGNAAMVGEVLFDSKRPDTLYAAAGQSGVLVSGDGGATWSDFAPEPPGWIGTLALDSSADLLYAGSYPTGVFQWSLSPQRTPYRLPFR
ncbi:MAG TPA: hypothetical protein VKJ00_04220, partial [Thermoanaerobaculia bacterium]|nr:hypothetical protein [Thermoanaerobaculia bacterium]